MFTDVFMAGWQLLAASHGEFGIFQKGIPPSISSIFFSVFLSVLKLTVFSIYHIFFCDPKFLTIDDDAEIKDC